MKESKNYAHTKKNMNKVDCPMYINIKEEELRS